MNRKHTLKFWLSTLILMLFVFSAGGSFDGGDFKALMTIIIGLAAIVFIVIAIVALCYEKKRKERKKMQLSLEENTSNFDMSDKTGDERCALYYDKDKKEILIALIGTNSIEKEIVPDIEKTIFGFNGEIRFAIDEKQKKLLTVYVEGNSIKKEIIDYSNKNWNSSYLIENIPPTIIDKDYDFILIDEQFGTVVPIMYRNHSLKHYIHYYQVDCKDIRSKSYIIFRKFIIPHEIGTTEEYIVVIQDEKAETLIVLYCYKDKDPSMDIIRYEDIISVSYIEDGNTISSKSMSRTIGGAIVGGALVGGAGAVVGGLSGDSVGYKNVSFISVKVLLRSSNNNSVVINCYQGKSLKTKDSTMKKMYEQAYNNAQQIKDIFSVIIDKMDRNQSSSQNKENTSNTTLNISDELIKLTKLKEQGILTDEEFSAQKNKLLNS